MSITVTIVTTANRTRRFTQTNDSHVQEILAGLRRSNQLFSNRTLIVGSPQETEIFTPSAITRIEIETQQDLSAFLPQHGDIVMSLIPEGSPPQPTEVSETHFSGRIDFFFVGGDSAAIWLSAPRPKDDISRLMRLTRMFEQPILMYKLPAGGVGFMNPGVMTRVVVAAAMEQLPAGAWQLDPV